ncbi:MAG: hypothetical protein ABFS86_07530, partial [Planctomycetota bacterium]
MTGFRMSCPTALLLLAVAVFVCGCEEERIDAFEGEVADHKLAVALHEVRPHLAGLEETEQAAIDTFIRRAGPRTTAFETRRILGLAG